MTSKFEQGFQDLNQDEQQAAQARLQAQQNEQKRKDDLEQEVMNDPRYKEIMAILEDSDVKLAISALREMWNFRTIGYTHGDSNLVPYVFGDRPASNLSKGSIKEKITCHGLSGFISQESGPMPDEDQSNEIKNSVFEQGISLDLSVNGIPGEGDRVFFRLNVRNIAGQILPRLTLGRLDQDFVVRSIDDSRVKGKTQEFSSLDDLLETILAALREKNYNILK